MFKLSATMKKDVIVLIRDRVGLLFMFIMPILLVVVITAIQNSTFELVNNNQVKLVFQNRDRGAAGTQLKIAIERIGIFKIITDSAIRKDDQLIANMVAEDALLVVIIPEDFSEKLNVKTKWIADKAMHEFGLPSDSIRTQVADPGPLTLYYHPVLQASFRASVTGALHSALLLVQSKMILKNLYLSFNEEEIPDSLASEMVSNDIPITEIPVSRNGSRNAPNATQHNIPAWTIFAMFFIVVSLGSSVVREKLNGSFLRLRTLPTNYLTALLSKQITYLGVAILQAMVIFTIGICFFPYLGLPKLNLPADIAALFIVSLVCGWCAVSFAICIGVFAQTEEQANGIGAASVVLMAAVGGLLVPSFAMPDSFQLAMKLSPLHWCLESYYGLFLEGGKLKDVLINLLPLFVIIILIQSIALVGLKIKKLI